jgi:hypothetical protein
MSDNIGSLKECINSISPNKEKYNNKPLKSSNYNLRTQISKFNSKIRKNKPVHLSRSQENFVVHNDIKPSSLIQVGRKISMGTDTDRIPPSTNNISPDLKYEKPADIIISPIDNRYILLKIVRIVINSA